MTQEERTGLLEAGYNESFDGSYVFKSMAIRKPGISEPVESATIFIDESSGDVTFEGSPYLKDALMDEYSKAAAQSSVDA